jgi:hypothetical protein
LLRTPPDPPDASKGITNKTNKAARLIVPYRSAKFQAMSIETLRQLPRSEKLKIMETLWEDLTQPDDQFESPAWHAQELAATEKRLAEGKEQVLDWEEAKETLRARFK